MYMLPAKYSSSDLKTSTNWNIKGRKKIFNENGSENKTRIEILTQTKFIFKQKL